MVYFIADPYFGHVNAIRLCNRPFETIEEMNETLIQNWNERIHGNDTVYIVGDMFFRCADPEAILKRLHGKKHLLIGNHDGSWIHKVDTTKYFQSVSHMLETSDGEHALTLCHYPLLSWNHQKRAYMIYGHLHANTDVDYMPQIFSRPNMLNAGVDINGFKPVTFSELVENNRAFVKKEIERSLAEKESETKRRSICDGHFLVDSLVGILRPDVDADKKLKERYDEITME